jgi:hypothetical protein
MRHWRELGVEAEGVLTPHGQLLRQHLYLPRSIPEPYLRQRPCYAEAKGQQVYVRHITFEDVLAPHLPRRLQHERFFFLYTRSSSSQ